MAGVVRANRYSVTFNLKGGGIEVIAWKHLDDPVLRAKTIEMLCFKSGFTITHLRDFFVILGIRDGARRG